MALASSQVERHFQRNKIYKRSREIFDVNKMIELERLEEVDRRKPTKSIDTLETRVDSSFQNSAEIQSNKLQQDIYSFKERYREQDTAISESDMSSHSMAVNRSRKIKGVRDWNRMSPRKKFFNLNPPYLDENQFNNFQRYGHLSPNKSVDFRLLSPRNRPNHHKTNSLSISHDSDNPETNLKTQKNNTFNSSVFKCLFDYSKTDSRKKIFKKRQVQLFLQPIPAERLEKSWKSTKVNHSPGLHEFYNSISRDSPGQPHLKQLQSHENYFPSKNERDSREQFPDLKRKQEMKEKRLQEIRSKRVHQLDSSTMCNQRFFFLRKQREKHKQ